MEQLHVLCASDEDFEFLVIGDWGDSFYWETPSPQKAVAAAMNDWAATHNPRFILTTGDNFYPDGVRVGSAVTLVAPSDSASSSLRDRSVIGLMFLLFLTRFPRFTVYVFYARSFFVTSCVVTVS